MEDKIKKQLKLHRRILQFVEYMVSGGVYFWSGYLAFFVFWSLLHWSLWWAKILADIIGWAINYMLQRFWVFSNDTLGEHRIQVTARYAVITLVDFGLDYVIVWGLRDLGLTPYLGQFVSAGFFTVWNYLWYRFWVFPETHTVRGRPVGSSTVTIVMGAQHVPHRGK
jgi:putative flippase GtrA